MRETVQDIDKRNQQGTPPQNNKGQNMRPILLERQKRVTFGIPPKEKAVIIG